eukprot:m.676592 g.676592  ORF g.676592 m.676592 type:complete len:61 (-) comp22791_c0_seq12:63-245(-)
MNSNGHPCPAQDSQMLSIMSQSVSKSTASLALPQKHFGNVILYSNLFLYLSDISQNVYTG